LPLIFQFTLKNYLGIVDMGRAEINSGLADQMVKNAVKKCAVRYLDGNIQHAISSLQEGRHDICIAFSHFLALEIAEYLGKMDKTVKAIYEYGVDPASARIHDTEQVPSEAIGINLVSWVERKSAALSALVVTLNTVLSEAEQNLGFGAPDSTHFPLDLKMVTDEDVQNQHGYAVIVNSELIHSTQVWPHIDQSPRIEAAEPATASQDSLLELLTSFDPEFAPTDRIINHALAIERTPPDQRGALEYHLTKLKVAIIRKIISDQLSYINIAKKWFTIEDLAEIHQKRIGYGRIGGKAAGLLLAERILKEVGGDDVKKCINLPQSYFIGSDLLYIFLAMNGLMHWNDQKYKPEEDIRSDYPTILEEFQTGKFPPEVLAAFENILEEIGEKPLIVRSSSQLEDNFGTIFAGKYDSFYCPNQGSLEERLSALTTAIAKTYASTLKPEALLYRRSKGLQDYDERMAVLIQVVQGEQFGKYFFPQASGVAFSRNLYRWAPEIRREDGFVRLVWGFGTRAVGRVGDDYPRLIALSHPNLQPDDSAEAITRYSQHYIDLIDLEENAFKTLPIHEVLSAKYKPLRYIAQLEEDNFLSTPRMRVMKNDVPRLVLTYDEFLKRTPFTDILSKILRTIEEHYHYAVDLEFTVSIDNPQDPNPDITFSLLQCRPQPQLQDIHPTQIPENLPEEDVIFSTHFIVPRGYLPDINQVIFINPNEYYSLQTPAARNEVSTTISKLNSVLEENKFICIGPGRWGSTNSDLGVFVSYADIYNAGALVEISGEGIGPAPEPSLGTHFFQDLMEAHIYPLAIMLDEEETIFNPDFFYNAPNSISNWLNVSEAMKKCVHVIDINDFRSNHHMEIVMDDEQNEAVGYLCPD
jgi:hypothetical protein